MCVLHDPVMEACICELLSHRGAPQLIGLLVRRTSAVVDFSTTMFKQIAGGISSSGEVNRILSRLLKLGGGANPTLQ
jgi:hypothetical protein